MAALNPAGRSAGLRPGQSLAGARALLPSLRTCPREPEAERQALERLCDWAARYSPWVALDEGPAVGGEAGLWLDVTGCAHLFGGEGQLLEDIWRRAAALGLTLRIGLADTPGAAWALARFSQSQVDRREEAGGPDIFRIEPGGQRDALASFPVAALRLESWQEELLLRFGLGRIGQLYELPPAGLEPRLGRGVKQRLDQALGLLEEPLSPRRSLAPFEERLVFGEAIAATEDLERAAERLVLVLCRRLRREGQGLRRLRLTAHRVDGSCGALTLGVSQATRDAGHLRRLLAPRIDAIDPGFGIEVMVLAADAAEPLDATQMSLTSAAAAKNAADLIDRLSNHLGEGCVFRLSPRSSHWPEAAQERRRPLPDAPGSDKTAAARQGADKQDWTPWKSRARPLRLLHEPEPIEALALLPDHPPARFTWRRQQHEVVRAEGPERILPEWWSLNRSKPLAGRDYFRVEDRQGRRFWLFRSAGRWYLHGLFG